VTVRQTPPLRRPTGLGASAPSEALLDGPRGAGRGPPTACCRSVGRHVTALPRDAPTGGKGADPMPYVQLDLPLIVLPSSSIDIADQLPHLYAEVLEQPRTPCPSRSRARRERRLADGPHGRPTPAIAVTCDIRSEQPETWLLLADGLAELMEKNAGAAARAAAHLLRAACLRGDLPGARFRTRLVPRHRGAAPSPQQAGRPSRTPAGNPSPPATINPSTPPRTSQNMVCHRSSISVNARCLSHGWAQRSA
jgi:hypothetical protein